MATFIVTAPYIHQEKFAAERLSKRVFEEWFLHPDWRANADDLKRLRVGEKHNQMRVDCKETGRSVRQVAPPVASVREFREMNEPAADDGFDPGCTRCVPSSGNAKFSAKSRAASGARIKRRFTPPGLSVVEDARQARLRQCLPRVPTPPCPAEILR